MATVLVVGSGISGLSAAIHVAQNGDRALLVSPFPSERSQSVMAAGGINAALNTAGEEDSVELHIAETLRGGCDIASATAVEGMCKAAPDIIYELEKMGTVFTRREDGNIDLRAFGGQSKKRTAYAGACTGKQIVSALVLRAREHQIAGLIERIPYMWFHSALIKDGECFGALFFNQARGVLQPIFADAVIMATGGQNALFGKTTGSTLCDGYGAARLFMQGVRLKNLEFIQYHPTTLETPQKRMLISEAARGEGGRLYYLRDGQPVYFMEERFGERGNLMPRDVVAKCIYDAPSTVYLDISHLGEKRISSRLLEVQELCLKYADIDVRRQSIPVYPSPHFFMGGIAVDIDHKTNIGRLYAVGECAAIYHGANRLGGNSLLAAVYSGIVAAKSVHSLTPTGKSDFSDYVTSCEEEILTFNQKQSKFSPMYLRHELAATIQSCLGITRTAEGLKSGMQDIDYFLSICDKLHLDSEHSLYQVYSLKPLLVLAKAVVSSADYRKETRGAHIREDFEKRDDAFSGSTVIEYSGGEYKIFIQREDAL